MGVEPGQKLLHYELVEQIGTGGMGVVYRARDMKLRRDVAIKILPDDFAQDRERLARFEREAHILASLNHPGIASIHGIEAEGGLRFLVLELVTGPTLADRIKTGPLSLDDALDVAGQIAEAVAEAHTQGIVHRDLKPANIKLSPDGRVKVLDFGLAKVAADGPASQRQSGSSQSPTAAYVETSAGVILGTAPYMSPEQARGLGHDKRSDMWSFGVVLYEMLTGRRLFQGKTLPDTLAAVLTQPIDWTPLPEGTPPALRRLLRRTLERDPRHRLHDMADARLEIEDARQPLDAATAP